MRRREREREQTAHKSKSEWKESFQKTSFFQIDVLHSKVNVMICGKKKHSMRFRWLCVSLAHSRSCSWNYALDTTHGVCGCSGQRLSFIRFAAPSSSSPRRRSNTECNLAIQSNELCVDKTLISVGLAAVKLLGVKSRSTIKYILMT